MSQKRYTKFVSQRKLAVTVTTNVDGESELS